jgi:hypothetical protein
LSCLWNVPCASGEQIFGGECAAATDRPNCTGAAHAA